MTVDLHVEALDASARVMNAARRSRIDIHSEVHMQIVISFMASLKRFGLDILDSLENYQD